MDASILLVSRCVLTCLDIASTSFFYHSPIDLGSSIVCTIRHGEYLQKEKVQF
uniref:Uncharacterized protein n=1 Tax=Arundo donax TaxID=35708 RepID=A0A0A9BPE5_ARUDO